LIQKRHTIFAAGSSLVLAQIERFTKGSHHGQRQQRTKERQEEKQGAQDEGCAAKEVALNGYPVDCRTTQRVVVLASMS
jgi:hypothetical protein